MADGSFRFQQPQAGQFYYPQHNQQSHHPQRHLTRTGSPVSRGATAYHNETPSPSRSPVTQNSGHAPYSMYNQTSHQQNVMMNGAPSHQRYAMSMNIAHKFQQTHQQQTAQQHHQSQQQDHGGPGTHGGAMGHQHTFSSGGLTNVTPHFTPSHLQNGTPANGQNGLNKPMSDYWAQQLQLAAEARQANSPHHHARVYAHVHKSLPSGTISAQTKDVQAKDGFRDERTRFRKENHANQTWMALDFGGQGLRSLSDALFNYDFLDKLYLNHNKLTYLPPSIGKLKNLTILDVSHNQLTDLPPEIGMLTNLKSFLLFSNEIRSLPYEIGYLYQLETLGIEGNPLDEDLREELAQNGTKALISHLKEQAPVSLPPSQRDWIVLDDQAAKSDTADRFMVLSYNILCQKSATSSQHDYSPSLALSWDYRKDLILNEIKELNADVVCLQEVELDSYNEFFRPELAYNDYKGVFWPRTRARTMAEKEAKLVDGCATFYKGSKYILLDKQLIDFSNTAINRPDMKGEHDIFNRVMPRDHIAVCTFLENRRTGSRVIVINTHIFWDPAYADVKLVQVAILMEQVAKLTDKYSKWPACTDKTAFKLRDPDDEENGVQEEPTPEPGPSLEYPSGDQIPLVICGDFNSTADSGVYKLLAHGKLESGHSDFGDRAYGTFTRDGTTHPFSLRSSYSNVGELSFTNYTPGFVGVIDYIWYSTNALQVIGLLGEIDKEYIQRVPGFPNYHFPSDHVALLTEFLVKPRKEKKVVEADFGPQRERKS